MPITFTEAIFILSAYNLCLGLLSSIAVTVSPGCPDVRAIETSFCTVVSTAGVSQNRISSALENVKQAAEQEQVQEACVIESPEPETEELESEATPVCFSDGFDSTFKAYMDYRCITDTSSVQYQLQQQAYTDDRGFRRIGDDYCVALGTGITEGCGERFLISLDSGYSFTAIVSDVKADIHTDSTNCYAPRGDNAGNIVEFIIDSNNADDYMLCCGSANCFEDLSGNVVSIQKI